MKKLILTAALSVASLAAFGQGTITVGNFQTKTTFVAPIFQYNPAAPGVEQVGNPSTASYPGALPTGTTVYGGPTAGSGFNLVFFYTTSAGVTSVTPATIGSLMSIGTQLALRSAATPSANPAGTAAGVGGIALLNAQAGASINWAFAAYSTENGAITSWAAALAAFNSGDANMQIGTGSVVSGTILGGTDSASSIHLEPATFNGWSSFSLITAAPEPSTIALAGLGAAGLLLFRRRK
jgi:PEP-CTERM motif